MKDCKGLAEVLGKKIMSSPTYLVIGITMAREIMEALERLAADEASKQPAADVVKVKHGRWIKVGESCGVDILECSVCHTIHAQDGDAFCRDCGARMDGTGDV